MSLGGLGMTDVKWTNLDFRIGSVLLRRANLDNFIVDIIFQGLFLKEDTLTGRREDAPSCPGDMTVMRMRSMGEGQFL